MKVRATKTITEYYSINEEQEYEVQGIVYFATPYFSELSPNQIDSNELRGFTNPIYSSGVIRNELVYIISAVTVSGRETWARFNAANFRVTDATIPDDWSTSIIDLHEEVEKTEHMYKDAQEQPVDLKQPLKDLKAFSAKIVVTGPSKLRSSESFFAVCDDDHSEK